MIVPLRTSPNRELRLVFSTGLLVILIRYLVTFQLDAFVWQFSTGLAACAIVWLCMRGRVSAMVIAASLLCYGVLLSVITIADGLVNLSSGYMSHRSSLFLENPNLLGASVAVSGLSVMLILPNRWFRIIMLILVGGALLMTGSRAALVGFGIGALTSWALNAFGRYKLLLTGFRPISFVAIIAAIIILLGRLYVPEDGNLLFQSTNLKHEIWSVWNDATVYIEPVEMSGPGHGGQVFQIAAQGRRDGVNTVVLLQGVGVAEPDEFYIASAYFKSDSPQSVIISSNLSASLCDVGNAWKRCATPPSQGNGHVQFQLRTPAIGASFRLYIWGPQVEAGLVPSAPEHTSSPSLRTQLTRSLAFNRITEMFVTTDNSGLDLRLQHFGVAWQGIKANPWVGHGLHASPDRWMYNNVTPEYTHAHNIVLQLLSELGLLGLLAHLIFVGGTLIVAIRAKDYSVIPLFITVGALNIVDYTFYNMGTYYIFWATFGLGVARFIPFRTR